LALYMPRIHMEG